MNVEKIRELLLSKKTADRKKAAKEVGENNLKEFSDLLFQSFVEENLNPKSWETIVQMTLSLGKINYLPALDLIKEIVEKNKPHDMITYAAAQTYVRLKRASLKDVSPIIELLRFGGLSIVDGALTPLAYDKMQPSNEDIQILLKLCWNLHEHKDRIGSEYGYTDPRYGLAAACAYWDKNITTAFLNHCIDTANNDGSLIYVAKTALQGKTPKLR